MVRNSAPVSYTHLDVYKRQKQWIIQRFRRLACRSFGLWCRNVAEHQLGQLVSFAVPPVVKSGIKACDFDVMLDKDHENHDHDMKYLHGHNENTAGESEIHIHEHGIADHACAHETESVHCHHHHEHRGVKEIAHIIEHLSLIHI